MHKFLVIFAVACATLSGLALAEEKGRKVYNRLIPADVLRDFPDRCFGGTRCETYKPGEEWDLKPFCGKSKCVLQDKKLLEQVTDCGPLPLPTPKCEIDEAKTDIKADFPKCCPVFKCENGAKPAFPEVPLAPKA